MSNYSPVIYLKRNWNLNLIVNRKKWERKEAYLINNQTAMCRKMHLKAYWEQYRIKDSSVKEIKNAIKINPLKLYYFLYYA